MLTCLVADWSRAIPRPGNPLRPRNHRVRVPRRAPDRCRLDLPDGPGPAKRSLRQHCAFGRQHPDQGLRRPVTQRGATVGRQGHEDKDLCTARAQVLDLDWRQHSCWPKHLQKGTSLGSLWFLGCCLLTCFDDRCGSASTIGTRTRTSSTPSSLECTHRANVSRKAGSEYLQSTAAGPSSPWRKIRTSCWLAPTPPGVCCVRPRPTPLLEWKGGWRCCTGVVRDATGSHMGRRGVGLGSRNSEGGRDEESKREGKVLSGGL
jgi:hypothetical protein